MKQEIKKEVVLQMIWDRHFDLGMEKDLDDICEDIYNEVFVLLLEKARKETAKDILNKIYKTLWSGPIMTSNGEWGFDSEIVFDLLNELAIQYGVKVEL